MLPISLQEVQSADRCPDTGTSGCPAFVTRPLPHLSRKWLVGTIGGVGWLASIDMSAGVIGFEVDLIVLQGFVHKPAPLY